MDKFKLKPKNQTIMIKKIIILMFLSLPFFESIAQKRIGVYNLSSIRSKARRFSLMNNEMSAVYGSIPSYCVDFFSNNPDFITIDRKNLHLIESEKEIQKSENFMDGYVVGQGKNEGLDYIVSCVLDLDTYLLGIRILEVENQKVLCSTEKELDKNFLGIKDLKQQVTLMLIELNSKCFDIQIPVVRMTNSKGKKAKELLIAAGKDLRMKKGYDLDIFKIVKEKIIDKVIERKVVIGKGEIISVEDENFSIIELSDGEAEIFTELNNGTVLNCKLSSKK